MIETSGPMGRGRAWAMAGGVAVLLGGCQVIPDGGSRPQTGGDPVATPSPSPSAAPSDLPQDEERHRIALLVPMSGTNGPVGQALANAAMMALIDTEAENLRITTYDTATGAGTAAARAIADGNALILGPLLSDNVDDVLAQARPADVPLITFSNDITAASRDTFVLGVRPGESIDRVVHYAAANGSRRYAGLIPNGEYGRRAEVALRDAVDDTGGQVVAIERYDRGNTSIVSAAGRLEARGTFDTVLIADSPRLSAQGAGPLANRQIMGTDLWSGEAGITTSRALDGAWFAALSDGRFRRFFDSYRTRFGEAPPRVATLGYDAVLLVLNVAQDWRPGREFPTGDLSSDDGFIGLDGAFRFDRNGIGYRMLEVRRVSAGEVEVVSPAPAQF